MSGELKSATGSFKSDGSSRDIKTAGFKPVKVELYGSAGDRGVWLDSMPDASLHKTNASGTATLATSNGITPLASGFTIGADSDLNNSGETIYWFAQE